MAKNETAQKAVEGTDRTTIPRNDNPAAGPHAKPHLTDESKTPGTGSLPEAEEESVAPGSG